MTQRLIAEGADVVVLDRSGRLRSDPLLQLGSQADRAELGLRSIAVPVVTSSRAVAAITVSAQSGLVRAADAVRTIVPAPTRPCTHGRRDLDRAGSA